MFVNLLLANATLVLACLAAWKLLGSRLAGLCAAAYVATDNRLFTNLSTALLTEPLFILLSLGVNALLLGYLRGRSTRKLAGACAVAGLAYLTRPNGLLTLAALGVVCAVHEAPSLLRGGAGRTEALRRCGARAAVCLVVAVAVTTPSWLPRLLYCGNPFYHEYLPNYMWADTYEEAHVKGPPSLGPRDYASRHGLADAAARLASGLKATYYEVGYRLHWPFSCLAVVGLLIGCTKAAGEWRLLTLMMFLELLPLAWAYEADPVPRIPHAVLLPFAVLYVGLSVAWFTERVWGARLTRAGRQCSGTARKTENVSRCQADSEHRGAREGDV